MAVILFALPAIKASLVQLLPSPERSGSNPAKLSSLTVDQFKITASGFDCAVNEISCTGSGTDPLAKLALEIEVITEPDDIVNAAALAMVLVTLPAALELRSAVIK